MKQFSSILFSLLFFDLAGQYNLPTIHVENSPPVVIKAAINLARQGHAITNSIKNRRFSIKDTICYQQQISLSNTTYHVELNNKHYKLYSLLDNQKINKISSDNNISYTLTAAAITSAGVFDENVLIRTLWNNEKRNAGTYDLSTSWDGKDDNGNYVADKTYTIKVISNNVTYDWLRPIGNTSDSTTGGTVHHAHQLYTNMVQVNSDMYCAVGYNEIGQAHSKFSVDNPNQVKTTLRGGGQIIRFLATDGNIVYSGGQRDGSTTFITGIVPNPTGTDTLATFSAGTPYSMATGSPYVYSAFDITGNSDYITGLAVQQTSNYLFASHATLSELRVFNKTTGATVRTNTLPGVRHVAMQGDNAIWLLSRTAHSGSTTASKRSGQPVSSAYISTDVPSNAFDGNSSTVFRSSGGPLNNLGLAFSSPIIVTQVKVKAQMGTNINAKLVGDNGWEKVELGTVTATNGSLATITVTNTNPFSQVRLDNPDGPTLGVEEMEVYGYTYSGSEVVSKYPINGDGTLGTATITLTGITQALAMAVSPDGTKIAVADRGAYHQVKVFNTSTGALMQTIGRAESYSNPTVYNDKFHFNNTRIFFETDYGATHAFVAFQTDGSVWVGDYGNMRCQHFAANGSYIDNIQLMGYSYSTQVDINNPTRVFSDFLEFSINYTDNSWTYVRNWSKNITIPTVYDSDRMRSVGTLSNGRTYCLYNAGQSGRELLELDLTIGIRHTGICMDNSNCDMNPDGSIWQIGNNTVGQPTFWKRKPLTDFDSNPNPLWGSYVTVETSPVITETDPVTADGYLKRAHYTATGVVATFSNDNGKPGNRGGGYHLGGIKNGQWLFKVSPSTHSAYLGDYPTDGAYDIGNNVNNAGSFMQVVDRNIFWGYIGEFWKASQTNKYNHYLDNGLMIGQFGAIGDAARGDDIEAYPGAAGNANSGTYVKVGDDIHFYHADEGEHAGIHHWKISNLSSIQTQSLTIIKTGVPVLPPLPYVDLMAGLPMYGPITSGTGRWAYSPTSYNVSNYDRWQVQAGTSTYKRDERSLRFTSYPTANGLTREGYCDLSVTPGTVNNCATWQITGRLTYPEISESNDNFIDIIDNSGKIIVRISRPQTYPNVAVQVNGMTIVSGALNGLMRGLFQSAQDLSIKRDENHLMVSYGGYPELSVTAFDPAANLSSPTTLRIHFYSANPLAHQIDLANLKIYPTLMVTGTCVTVKSGSWIDSSIWSCDRVPTYTDIVRLRHNVIIPSNYSPYAKQIIYELPFKLNFDVGTRLWLNN